MQFDTLSNRVIGYAIEVHRNLGPGLLESTYEECLSHELSRAGIAFQRQKELPITYKGLQIDGIYRIDLLVDNKLLVEIKSVDTLLGIHRAQLLTYMKLSKVPLGLLLNFNVEVLKDGVRRLLLNDKSKRRPMIELGQ